MYRETVPEIDGGDWKGLFAESSEVVRWNNQYCYQFRYRWFKCLTNCTATSNLVDNNIFENNCCLSVCVRIKKID